MIRSLFNFRGGVHLPEYKSISNQTPVHKAKLPERLVLPLTQHIGNPSEPQVSVGEYVLKGQKIAHANGYVSVPLHAPTSGTIVAIDNFPVPHPSGLSAPCIVLKPDGKEQWTELQPHGDDYRNMDASELRNLIRSAGIVGLGGAGFPSFIKHNPGPTGHADTLIINAAECEPYITCDDRLMQEKPAEIIKGIEILQHAVNAKRCVIAVEDNKQEAIQSLTVEIQKQATKQIEVIPIPTVYPAGSEKQIIYTITGRQVPKNGLPIHVGVVCQNVGTTAAIYRAVHFGEPLISRYVTITGDVAKPGNFDVLIGTSFDDLINQCGGNSGPLRRLIVGGPMMGFAMHEANLPVIKTTNCVLVDAGQSQHMIPRKHIMPCIRCGSCADACPVDLLPQQLYWYARSEDLTKIQDYHLFDCIECGCCDYVCPSQIPLVQYYRFAKSEIWKREREKQKSDAARDRHEFRQFRLEREKEEKAERHRQRKEALSGDASSTVKEKATTAADPKKAAILAAMERVKAKKAAQNIQPKNTENLTEAQKKLIAEADERRKQHLDDNHKADSNEDKHE